MNNINKLFDCSEMKTLTKEEYKNLSINKKLHRCFFVVFQILLFMFPTAMIFSTIFSISTVQGVSMMPTYKNKEKYLVMDNNFIIPYEYKRGDIVAVKIEVLKKDSVKRIIGIEGDHIVVKDGKVYRNNIELKEDYVNSYNKGNVEIVVPKGKVFLMGDNRENSIDSRLLGCIDYSDITGKFLCKIN